MRERISAGLSEAEERRLARIAGGSKSPSLRARLARRLFEAAVVMERNATWRAVREKMEASKYP